jgi:hypothetical protein
MTTFGSSFCLAFVFLLGGCVVAMFALFTAAAFFTFGAKTHEIDGCNKWLINHTEK